MTKPDWQPVESLFGYAVEMDVSRPNGRLRHRLLPKGAWHDGMPPETLEAMVGPSMEVTFDGTDEEARTFLDQLDAKPR